MKTHNLLYKNKYHLIALILFSNLITYLNYLLDWPLVKQANLRVPSFIDLNAVVESIECAKSANPNSSLNSLFLTCNYIYGSPLLIIGKHLSFTSSNTSFYAWVLMIFSNSLIAAIIHLSINNFKKALIAVALIISSPVISLLFERANIDSLIFLLVILSAYLHAKKQFLLSTLIILAVTLVKFYTLFLFIILALFHMSKKNYFVLIPISVITTLSVVLDLERIKKIPVAGRAQFGTGVFSWYFDEIGFYTDKIIWIIFGVGVTFIFAYLFIKVSHNYVPVFSSKFSFRSTSASEVALAWSSLVFLSCFLVGFNYDYRLVFLVFGGFLIYRVNYSTRKYLWEIIYLISLWGTIGIRFTFSGSPQANRIITAFVQFLGDVSVLLIASYFLAYFLRSLQPLSPKAYFRNLTG